MLILLDPHNLPVNQKLLNSGIATFAISFTKSLKMANCDIQTSYGGLKVSDFTQEFISEVYSKVSSDKVCLFDKVD